MLCAPFAYIYIYIYRLVKHSNSKPARLKMDTPSSRNTFIWKTYTCPQGDVPNHQWLEYYNVSNA